jgi:putative ABC transport system ATP-binding protein
VPLHGTGLVVEHTSGGYVVRPIDGLDFAVEDGELALLLGPSGCGKTTLLSAVAGILTPAHGSIRHGEVEVTTLRGAALTAYRRTHVGVVFQAFHLIPSLTARENVEVPLRAAGRGRAQARARAEELLADVGLAERAHHRPAALSGGQQQRVAIARALALDPPLLLADEPTAHLDYLQVDTVVRLLRRIADQGRTVLVSTHDDRLVPLADRVVDLHPVPADTQPGDVQLAAGQVLFEQGDPGDLVYVVLEGDVDIVRERAGGGEELLATVGPGSYFGELAPLLRMRRSATARARTAATLRGMSIDAFRRGRAATDAD